EHGAGRRDCRRVDPDAARPRAPLRAARAPRRGCRPRGPLARRVRHRADRAGLHQRRPRGGPRRAASIHRALRRRDGLPQAELLQPAGPALRVRGCGARGPGPLPRGQEGRGRRGAARRAHRPHRAGRSQGRRARAHPRLPGRGGRHARRLAVRLHQGRAARAAAARRGARRRGVKLLLLLGAYGDPGHAFPMLALGRALAARGNEVTLQTRRRWGEAVEAEGMRFAAAPEYHVFPTRERPLKPYQAVVRAARETLPLVDEMQPDAVVADILTLAPAMAGELRGVPVATLVPHVWPVLERGWPPYAIGARRPRTAVGRALWGALDRVTRAGLERGREELNETRA